MSKMKTWLMFSSHYEMVKNLTNEQLGMLLRALYLLSLDEPTPKLDAATQMAFAFISRDVINNNNKYEEICNKNRENIKKRWAKYNEAKQSYTTVYDRIPNDTTRYINNDNDNDNDDVFFTENNKEKDKKESEIIIPEVVSVSTPYAELSEAWGKWKDYKSARRERYSCSAAEESAYRQLYSLSKGDAALAMQIVEQSIANDWKGLYELKQNDNANTKTSRSGYKTATERLRDDYASIFASVLTNTAGGSKVS